MLEGKDWGRRWGLARNAFGELAGYWEYGGETVMEENCSKKGPDSGSELIRWVVYWGRYDLWEGNTEEEPCQCEWARSQPDCWEDLESRERGLEGRGDTGGSGGSALGYWGRRRVRKIVCGGGALLALAVEFVKFQGYGGGWRVCSMAGGEVEWLAEEAALFERKRCMMVALLV